MGEPATAPDLAAGAQGLVEGAGRIEVEGVLVQGPLERADRRPAPSPARRPAARRTISGHSRSIAANSSSRSAGESLERRGPRPAPQGSGRIAARGASPGRSWHRRSATGRPPAPAPSRTTSGSARRRDRAAGNRAPPRRQALLDRRPGRSRWDDNVDSRTVAEEQASAGLPVRLQDRGCGPRHGTEEITQAHPLPLAMVRRPGRLPPTRSRPHIPIMRHRR